MTKLKMRVGIGLLAVVLFGILAVPAAAQCPSTSVSFLSRSTLRFVIDTSTHNATMPGQPSNFATKGYRFRVAEKSAAANNPLAPVGGWKFSIDIPRDQMSPVPDVNECYISPIVTLSENVPVWKEIVTQVVALSERAPGDTNMMESSPSPLSPPFTLGLLRLTAVRNVAAP